MESGQKADVSPLDGEIAMEMTKSCSDCKTSKTPLWRSGPTGPKSLCNACGIRYRKILPSSSSSSSSSSYENDITKVKLDNPRSVKLRNGVKVNLMLNLNQDGRISPVMRLRSPRQWGEVERAALLLMALSCGALFV